MRHSHILVVAQEEHGGLAKEMELDSSVFPSCRTIDAVRRMVFAKEHGCDDPVDTRKRLNALRDDHVRQQTGVKMSVLEPSDCITQPDAVGVVLLTPLMDRVHRRVPEAGLINFVDSTFNCSQEEGVQVYLMYCPSKCGGLPLGAIITTCKSQQYLTALWQEYKKLLPPDAFGGRGAAVEPRVFMTDDEDALRASLAQVRNKI